MGGEAKQILPGKILIVWHLGVYKSINNTVQGLQTFTTNDTIFCFLFIKPKNCKNPTTIY